MGTLEQNKRPLPLGRRHKPMLPSKEEAVNPDIPDNVGYEVNVAPSLPQWTIGGYHKVASDKYTGAPIIPDQENWSVQDRYRVDDFQSQDDKTFHRLDDLTQEEGMRQERGTMHAQQFNPDLIPEYEDN